MFETKLEMKTITDLDEELGLRELRAKVNGRAGMSNRSPANRFSIGHEYNYGSASAAITRMYLDSGALQRLLENDLWKDNRCWKLPDMHKFITLAAGAMTIGCKLPARMKENLEKMVSPVYQKLVRKQGPSAFIRHPLAIKQLKTAVETYQEGTPYDFGHERFLDAFFRKTFPGSAKGGQKMMSMIGPPSDEELNLKPIFPAHVCADCGKEEKEDGKPLDRCARCQDRKYCSKACQKRHWSLHKIICSIPKEEMEALLNTIPFPTPDGVIAKHF